MSNDTVRWRCVIPAGKPITNANFDPIAMLRLAQAGSYPSAAKTRGNEARRAAEIAYWQDRCQQAGTQEEEM